MVTLTKHVIPGLDLLCAGRGPWYLGDFCNIFQANISEDQKVLPSEGRALPLSHMANTALVIALHS